MNCKSRGISPFQRVKEYGSADFLPITGVQKIVLQKKSRKAIGDEPGSYSYIC